MERQILNLHVHKDVMLTVILTQFFFSIQTVVFLLFDFFLSGYLSGLRAQISTFCPAQTPTSNN